MCVCTHTSIFYHMKIAIANFLVSYFISDMWAGKMYNIFIFQKLFILEVHFYNGLISLLDNESTVSDGISFI